MRICIQNPSNDIMHAEVRLLDLVSAMEDLKAMRNNILREIEYEEGKGKQRTQKVQLWLEKVEDKDQRAKQLVIDFSKCCVTGCCPLNIYSRLHASRKAAKLLKEVHELMKERVSFVVSVKTSPSTRVIDIPISSTIVGRAIKSNLRVVRDCLADKKIGITGIYGMGGVGKTTLLKEINNSINDWNMGFDHVIYVTASYALHVEALRGCIAECLALPKSSRETIFKFLKYKNFVLLLDDLWEELDITVLGIPDPHDDSDVTTRFKHKVVFTTRSEHVCDCMGADRKIKLECLNSDEGWQLFKEHFLMNFELMPSAEEAAREVVNLCRGLPLALVMVGQAMLKTSKEEWNFMLHSLSQGRLFSGLCEPMHLYLRSSYDSLPNKIPQQCFLCLCLWPRNKLISTEDLIKCWLGFGLVYYYDNLSEAYTHGCYIIKILEEASLVVTHDNKAVVEVHDMIYDMAQWIVSKAGDSRKTWLVRQNSTLEQLSSVEAETWFQAERVSLVNCDMNSLLDLQCQCPSLLSLNIQCNQRLEYLPKIFFQQMPNLTYLNLSSTGIHELPTEIMHLFHLEFLDISRTRIKSLPHKLAKLKRLKYLFCGYLFLGKLQYRVFPSSVQVLDVYPYGWVEPRELKMWTDLKGIGMCAPTSGILTQLSKLPIVNINIQGIEGLLTLPLNVLRSEDRGWPQELQIRSCTAIQNLVIRCKTNLKCLRLSYLPKLESFFWEIEPKEVLSMLQVVQIEECHGLKSLHWVLHLPLLRDLSLKNCDEMEELVDGEVGEIEGDDAITTFPKLKYLTIIGLPKLVRISRCALDFPRLLEVHLGYCPNLNRLPFKPDIVNSQGLLIKCQKKWWERLEWEDATFPSQFFSSSIQDEEIVEFSVGTVPARELEDSPRMSLFDEAMSYVLHAKEKLDDLEKAKEEDLMAKKQGIQRQLEYPQNKGKQPSDELYHWIQSFREIQSPVPVHASYRTVGKGTGINVDIVRSYLEDEAVGMVGIWGMGGVGKTTLLRKVYNSLLDDGNMGFDHVLFIEATQDIQLGKLREEIAKQLQLASSTDAKDIFNVLKTKNFALLLDDIWEEVDLVTLGIPHPYSQDSSTKQDKGKDVIEIGATKNEIAKKLHKVIFTTRSEAVCALMQARKTIGMGCMEEDEAWDLFKENVNLDVLESDERIKDIAKQVMNMCGGLPLALKVLGKAMSNKRSVQQWQFILRSLKNSNTKVVQGVEESLFPILKFSYDNLPYSHVAMDQ